MYAVRAQVVRESEDVRGSDSSQLEKSRWIGMERPREDAGDVVGDGSTPVGTASLLQGTHRGQSRLKL